jgi:hypothetical protein
MKFKNEYIIGCGLVLTGMIFFCIYQELLIVHFGTFKKTIIQEEITTERKKIDLFFWKNDRFKKESVEIMWSDNKADTLHYIVNQWLNVLDEEEILDKKVLLQHVCLNKSESIAYLSFDRYIFNKESSTYQKYMIIEGLLKTVRESSLKIPSLHFLIHHKPIVDSHLDFNHPWPLHGFIEG